MGRGVEKGKCAVDGMADQASGTPLQNLPYSAHQKSHTCSLSHSLRPNELAFASLRVSGFSLRCAPAVTSRSAR